MRTHNSTVIFRLPEKLREELEAVRGEKRISEFLREIVTGYCLLNGNRQK